MHYRYGPSSSKRWMTCPGSIKLSKGIEDKESIWAAEGSAAHEVGEKALKSGTDAIVDNDEVRRSVQVYLDEIRSVETSHEVIFRHTEKTIEHRSIADFGGTSDHFAVYLDGEKIVLHAWDYKHGVGVPVDVIENTQVLSYFAIIGSHFPGMIDTFRGTIVQPRCFAGDEVQTWECDAARVTQHEEDVRKAMASDHFEAGEHCRWCKAALVCDTLRKHALDTAKLEFEDVRDDAEKLAELMRLTPAIQMLLKKVPGAMMERFRDGNGVPGYKVVAKRDSNREWLFEGDEMIEELTKLGLTREDVIEEKLKSPTQVEKVLPDKEAKKALSKVVVRRPTGFKVVPESDKGEAIDLTVNTAKFDFEENEDDNEG